MEKKKKSKSLLFIPLSVGISFAVLNFFLVSGGLELGLYDTFLKLKPEVKEAPSLVLLDVDEPSIAHAGSWPWPRGLMARGLEVLADLGASTAVFDIEYINNSPMSVDREYLEGGLRAEFNGLTDEVGSNVSGLFNSLSNGTVKVAEAGEYGQMLLDDLDTGMKGLYEKTRQVAVPNDTYLGQAMRLFGNANVTLNLQTEDQKTTPEVLRTLARERYAYPNLVEEAPVSSKLHRDYLVPIPEVSRMAANAGFTNVVIDDDGVRRRIRLADRVGDKVYLQLAFQPLVRSFGSPVLVSRSSSLLIQGALVDGKNQDIEVPLDEKGNMMINWPKKDYLESFRHVSFFRLLEYRQNEERLADILRSLGAVEAWGLAAGENPADRPVQAWAAAEEARKTALGSGTPADREAWLAARRAFRTETQAFLAAGWDQKLTALIDGQRAHTARKDLPLLEGLRDRFLTLHSRASEAETLVEKAEKELKALLAGSYCIIGWTATATTDMGANPFHTRYINVGTHASLVNTILQRDFITPAPAWVGSLVALALSFLVILAIARLKTAFQIAAGLGATAAVLGGSFLVFRFTGLYLPTVAPALATFISFLAYTLVSFLLSEKEKSFLRKAFGTYLSGDVINEMLADPTMLKLGGQKKWITAMFTDVKGFSTISESLDPEHLVKLLNLYLSGMSDLILENRGTIDKYEGDAIISFFGAPVSYPEHALKACRSAVLMKKREAELNQRFLADGLTPTPLLTRIGLNTGDMVVGNMGTERKMDYTIMGNAVNLAARLEGVNKQYGSWILASDATRKEAGDEIVARRLDRVRVVGIHTPVQLWEIVDLRAEADDRLLDFLDRFEKAHDLFEARDWKKALDHFTVLHAERPQDGPSAVYRKRSEHYLTAAPEHSWDGVFSLSEK